MSPFFFLEDEALEEEEAAGGAFLLPLAFLGLRGAMVDTVRGIQSTVGGHCPQLHCSAVYCVRTCGNQAFEIRGERVLWEEEEEGKKENSGFLSIHVT